MNYLLNSPLVKKYICKDKRNSFFLILFLVFLLTIIFSLKCRGAELPDYLIKYANAFKIPIWYVSNFSYAESSHNPGKISYKNAYGRFQISKSWLEDYCRYNGFDIRNIKDIKKFLLNDKNNCYIACWSIRFWLNKEFTYREIIQIWLWGLRNVYKEKRWSYQFEKKVFGDIKKTKLNYKSFNKLSGLNIKE